jgi:hypothetical protein
MEATPKEIALKTIARMRPEVARRSLLVGRWYNGGFYVAPDFSCCCPFGAGVITNPRHATAESYCAVDEEVSRAFRMAGFYDAEQMLLSKFVAGLPELTQEEIRAAIAEAMIQ